VSETCIHISDSELLAHLDLQDRLWSFVRSRYIEWPCIVGYQPTPCGENSIRSFGLWMLAVRFFALFADVVDLFKASRSSKTW
jgi:hypothetical protein